MPRIADVLERITVREVMTPAPFAVTRETSLREAGLMMVDHKINELPVVDTAGKVVGIITQRVLFESLIRRLNRPAQQTRPVPARTLEAQVAY